MIIWFSNSHYAIQTNIIIANIITGNFSNLIIGKLIIFCWMYLKTWGGPSTNGSESLSKSYLVNDLLIKSSRTSNRNQGDSLIPITQRRSSDFVSIVNYLIRHHMTSLKLLPSDIVKHLLSICNWRILDFWNDHSLLSQSDNPICAQNYNF